VRLPAWGAGAAAVDAALVAIPDTVVARRLLADTGPAHAGRAVLPGEAPLARGAERARPGAAVDAGLEAVRDAVGARRGLARLEVADAVIAVHARLASGAEAARLARASAVGVGLSFAIIRDAVAAVRRDAGVV
jgi:hypothetical protein